MGKDVYKRQGNERIPVLLDQSEQPHDLPLVHQEAAHPHRVLIEYIAPVSYTHLDVYKRQVEGQPVLFHLALGACDAVPAGVCRHVYQMCIRDRPHLTPAENS